MRLKWMGTIGVAIALAGCDVPPEGTNTEDMTNYQTAVASIGCQMRGESDYLTVEFQAGLTRQQTLDITGHHLATQQAVRDADGTVRIKAGPCATSA